MRCPWGEQTEDMQQYHDTVWGVSEYDDQKLFRKLILDINQAGLSWQTVLNKSEAFDKAYDQFDIQKVANYGEAKMSELMGNKGITRNCRKVEAAVRNAEIVLKIQKEFGSFSEYLWSFSNGKIVDSSYRSQEEVPTTSSFSDELAKDLKKRGFKFIESTTIYAFLETVGIINDHLDSCFRKEEIVRIGKE